MDLLRIFTLRLLCNNFIPACASIFDTRNTCGDGLCVSPEFSDSCPEDCGDQIANTNLLRDPFDQLYVWHVRPEHLATQVTVIEGRKITNLIPGKVLYQSGITVKPGTIYDAIVETSRSCVETFLHTESQILGVTGLNGTWTAPPDVVSVSMTIRSSCETNITHVSLKPIPVPQNVGWKYYEIVDSILYDPVRIDARACREKCVSDLNCCAWQVCPGTEAEGCGGCYLLGRRPLESSAERKENWVAAIERSRPGSPIGVDECRIYLLSQSSHEKDFYDSSSGKLSKYVQCANIIRGDRTVPKQVFMGGVHIPTLLVANHRNPDPRLSGGTTILPHFYILPFYDTNIGNIMKHTSAMNIVQSYEMQSILRPGEVFVDAGANLGSYTLAMAEHVGPSGIVIAFEPFRWLFQLLNGNIAANGFMNCWTFQSALGDSHSYQSLLQPNLRFFSSPGGVRVDHQLTNVSAETQKQLYDFEWGTEVVETVALDDVVFAQAGPQSVFRNGRTPQVHLIKIDVEGMELNVIRGSVKILSLLKPVVWVENVAFFDSGDKSLLNLMDSMSYLCWKSLSAGNDLVCEPKDGSRSERLSRIRKAALPSDSSVEPPICSS